jgi:cytoskeletal protein CcmA (bactofilin family)
MLTKKRRIREMRRFLQLDFHHFVNGYIGRHPFFQNFSSKEYIMSNTHKLFSILTLFILLTLTFVSPAYAFDGRSGDKIVIQAGDVVNDDLYVGANEFVLEGTVNGDVVAFAQTVTVNGSVNGDLITAAQTVVVNGTVTGNIRMAGSVLFVGEKAKISGDILGAGYSLEVRKGSTVGRDVVYAGGQILLAADVTRNVIAATAALEIAGNVGGNVKAEVGEAGQTRTGPPPTMFMQQSTVPVPLVKEGLTIDPSAKITGNLEYTQNNDLSFPAGVVGGKITRTQPPADQNKPSPQETAAQKVTQWSLQQIRSLITLLLIGLFLLWLFPGFTKALSEKLQTKPWPSLGWGVVTFAGFFFLILLTIFVTILGAIIFGLLTLGSLSASIVWIGILTLLAMILGFVLATSFVAKVVFGLALGKWILARANSPLADHKFWPMVIGVAITVLVVALLTFPLIPGFLGGLLNFAIILFGLGTLWLWGREGLAKKPVAAG